MNDKRLEDMVFCNRDKPVLNVNYFDLRDWSEGRSRFRRECPVCEEGLLLLTRTRRDLIIMSVDACTLCGQQFMYLDVDRIRREAP